MGTKHERIKLWNLISAGLLHGIQLPRLRPSYKHYNR